MTTEATATDLQAFTENWLDWYRAQEGRLADPHGFLAITGLHWLDDRPQRFPDAPGAWHTGRDGVVVDLDDGEVSPAHSAMVQQFLRDRSADRPSTNRAALRRGSTRAKRPAIRPIRPSTASRQRVGSML